MSMRRSVDAAAGQPGGAPDQDFEYTWSDRVDTAASHDHEPVTAPIPIPGRHNFVPDQPDYYAWDEAGDVPAGGVQLMPQPVDVYDLVPDQPDDHESPTRSRLRTRSTRAGRLCVGRPRRSPAGPHRGPTPSRAPLRCGRPCPSRRRHADARISAAAVVPHQAGGDGTRRCRGRRGGVWRLAGVAQSEDHRRTIENRGADQRPACPEQRPTHRDERSAAASASPASSAAFSAGGWAGLFRAATAIFGAAPRSGKPEIGATRTPATRAPISVAPVPRPVAGSDSSTPGDAPGRERPRRRGCFGFC